MSLRNRHAAGPFTAPVSDAADGRKGAPGTNDRGAVLRALDTAHFMHPFTDYKSLAAEGGSRIIEKAQGAWIEDINGARIIDGMAGLWCVAVGYGRKELADAAYKQMMELSYYNAFFKTATVPSIELSKRLAELTPEGLNHVFYASSGSEANDTIFRMVRHYWNLRERPEKKTIISRTYGYHGSTVAATSLSGMKPMHGQGDISLAGIEHIMPPYWYGLGGDMSPEEFGKAAAKALEDKIDELGEDKVAAFIAEPVQGAGGLIIPPESYWPEINRICRERDILLIADEVITGFGRTGHWFACEKYGIRPDFLTMAKTITSGYQPLSALMVSDRVAETFIEKGGEFYHGFTYSGHPVACAVALANLDIIENEGLIPRIKNEIGPYFSKRLTETFADHPLVGEVRTVGLLAGIELSKDRKTREFFPNVGKVGTMCRDHCFRNDLIMRAVRDTMVLSPVFTITEEEVDELVRRAKLAIDATAKDLGYL
jgi:putrescine---pyruvate transaminase